MILNLGQVCSYGTTMAGGRPFSLSEASFWANMALEAVVEASEAKHQPRESLAISSTTSGGNRIALPSDFEAPLALTLYQGSSSTATTSRVTTEIPLYQRDAAWLDGQPDQFSGGVPEAYVPYSSWVELYPSPNSAYSLQLRYTAKQPTLVDSTNTPALNEKWHQAWLLKSVEYFHAARDDREGEALARNRYINYVSTIPTDLALKQQDRKSMSIRFGGGRKYGRLD